MIDPGAQKVGGSEAQDFPGDDQSGVIEQSGVGSTSRSSAPVRAKTLLGHAKVTVHLLEPTFEIQKPSGVTAGHGSARLGEVRKLPAPTRSFALLNAHELAQRVCERARELARAKEVNVILRCACNRIWVHPHAFAEALYELVKNAVQATRKRYPVIVDVRNTGEGDVLWQIRDGGKGMSERALAQLGQPPRSALKGGSGLGVAYAWAVIEKHGGLLRFESAAGVGTTASIWLPEPC